jgi:hypothetical protein
MKTPPNKQDLNDLMLKRLAVTAKTEKRPRYPIWDERVEHMLIRV